jgi:PAS domain S-box-containing protein
MKNREITSEELSRCLFSESNDAFFIVDPKTLLVTSVNPTARRLTGLTERELVGHPVDQLILAEEADDISNLVNGCRHTTFIHARDGYHMRGKRGTLDVSVSQSRLHGETKVWSLIVVRDITERKALEYSLIEGKQELEKALKSLCESQEELINQEKVRAIGELARGVAHDLNNLLVPAVVYTELLLEQNNLPAETQSRVRFIANSVKESAAVVLELQRDMTDDRRELESVPVRDMIEACRILSRPHWENLHDKRIEFLVSVADNIPDVQGNKTDLHRVLINLVLNAVHSMTQGGQIVVAARELSDQVEITVKDVGNGMDASQKSRALDLFYTTRTGGTGLGLNLCRRIVENHRGKIDIESELGQGTTVRIRIPQAVGKRTVESSHVRPSLSCTLSVLYIDDDDMVRESIAALLRIMGVSVDSAPDGRTGIQMFNSGTYDVVLTDLGMDGYSGWDVIREVQQRSASTPVCLISGWSREEVCRSNELNCVPDFILTKPVSKEDLVSFLAVVETNVAQQRSLI